MSAIRRRGAKGQRQKRGLHPLAVALTLIVVTVAIVYYAFSHSIPFLHHYTLYTVVNNSVNVRGGDPVRIAGIDVGAVSGVSPDGEATRIAFTLQNSALPVHSDATVRIRYRLFLEGSYYLELDPGSPSAPALRDGDTIPESQTSTPVQFYNVLSTFDVATRANLSSLLNSANEGFSPQPGHPLSDSGAGGLKTAIPQLQPVLKDVAWVTRSLQGTQPGDVENLFSSASPDGALAQTFSELDQTLTAAPPALSAIDHALPPLANLAAALDPSLKVAPPIIEGVTSSVQQLAAVVAPVERGQLLTSLKATFEEFPAILSQLATAFPITKQVTDCLQTHATPILQRVVPDGPLTTGNPVWQDFEHFLPGLRARRAISMRMDHSPGHWPEPGPTPSRAACSGACC